MKNTIISVAAIIAALAVVLGQRLIIPALILIFKAVEASFAPEGESLAIDTTKDQTIAHTPTTLNAEDTDRADGLASSDASATATPDEAISQTIEPSAVTTPKRATRRRRATKAKATAAANA